MKFLKNTRFWYHAMPTFISAGMACSAFLYQSIREQTFQSFKARKDHIGQVIFLDFLTNWLATSDWLTHFNSLALLESAIYFVILCENKNSLDQKIQKLYGPLYGNRLMYQSGIDAVSERQKMSIKQYIRKVCEEKDEIGLESKYTFSEIMHVFFDVVL